MYVLTACAFLTPRSSAIWLDSDEKKIVRKKHGEIMTCLILSGLVSQRKRLKLFHVIWKQPFPCQKIYLASQRNHEHHFILLYALYACEEVLQLWLEFQLLI